MDERDIIRSRINIVDLIQEGGTQLRKYGKHWKGLCPFHSDTNPSFTVTEETGRYKCWACGEAGDAFTWVMKTQNLDFGEAIRSLAKRAGVTLAQRGGPTKDERGSLDAAMEEALVFFREQLDRTILASDYCNRRGLDPETQRAWELGYAPELGEALAVHLSRKGFSLKLCEQLFLVAADSQGGFFDKFRGRLMFPIRDEKGSLVAFGGRLLGEGNAKYINSSDTPLYRKSRVLYGLHQGKQDVIQDRKAVLCEGYIDVIACHKAGIRTAVASLGTALADEQVKLLKRWVDEVIILYDSDKAGQKAAAKAIQLLRSEALKVKVALMPSGDDPDSVLRREGPTALVEMVANALSPMEYGVQAIEQRLKPTEDEFWVEVVGHLAEATSEMELDRFLFRIAPQYPGTTDVVAAVKALRKQVLSVRRQKRQGSEPDYEVLPRPKLRVARPKMTGAEVTIFWAFTDEQFRMSAWVATRSEDFFITQTARELAQAIQSSFPSGPPSGPLSSWITKLQPEDMQDALSEVLTDERNHSMSKLGGNREPEDLHDGKGKSDVKDPREAYIMEAVKQLQTKREERWRRSELLASKGLDDKARVFEQLMDRKGIKEDPSPEDDLF